MLPYKTHTEKIRLIQKAQLSLIENVEFFLSQISAHKDINAFNFLFDDAIDRAKKIEQKINDGTSGKLAGMVIAVKDLLSVKDKPLTCSSKILSGFEAIYTATSIQKLIDEDAILIGKTNCDEFGMGSTNENSAFGTVLNPLDKSKVPGGSSGGSAAAVAANFCDAAIGTDTGGSIRQPAAFTGTFGIKPTYGRVSRYGLTAYASSFDCVGPIAKNVSDLALILQVLSGKDEHDSTSSESNEIQFSSQNKKYKIGLPREYFVKGLDDKVKNGIEKTIENLKKNGHEIIEISLPHSDYTIAAYYILATAEASSNLARFDGVRYGLRNEKIKTFDELYNLTKTEGFGKEVKRRIMLGTYVLSSGYYDAYYSKAQKVRRLIKEDFDNAFQEVDLIISPTAPSTAYKIGDTINDPLQMYLGDIFTVSANLTGIPAISVPYQSENSLPIGIQFMASHFNEDKLLDIAQQITE
ncbi:aspartyl-trna(asn) amidotransferase subunit a [hydrocarbon metagenome]|uniref:glutaminyl-tRNA synthase (glutamine-hydrolyzing) n=1 Tax=hydrocarbon metagenome TaxID=938273 RepID=A0A0W8FYF7_9ZZZZ